MKRSAWQLPLLLAGAVCLAFLPALNNGFVNWDDESGLVNNPAYRGLGWDRLWWMFTTFDVGIYQPLTWLSFALDHAIWGMNPLGYHLSNLLLHAANAALFYWLGLKLLTWGRPRIGTAEQLGAAFSALFFGLHPLRVESVAWVTERRDVLSGFFFLVAILCYLRACGDSQPSSRRPWLLRTNLACLFCLLSKAVGITMPAVLVLLDVYPLRRLPVDPRRWFSRPYRALWREKAPIILMSLWIALVAYEAQKSAGAVVAWGRYGAGARAAQVAYDLSFYIEKTLLPVNLSPLYEKSSLLEPGPFWIRGMAALALTALFLGLRRSWPAGLASWACYILMLIPMLGLVKTGRHIAADRYTYLPCLAWALLGGAAFRSSWEAMRAVSAKAATLACGAALLFSLGFLSWRQTGVWHDSISLWQQAIAVNPQSYVSHRNLARALIAAGRPQEAAWHLERDRRLQTDIYYKAALLLIQRGEPARAVFYLQRVLEIMPAHPRAGEALERARRLLGDRP